MGYGYYTRVIDGLERHLGYAVRALCDHPDCNEVIDRGLGYLCGHDPGDDTEDGCGRYFCGKHLWVMSGMAQNCERCAQGASPWPMKPDLPDALEGVRWNTPADELWARELSEKSRCVPRGVPPE